MSGELSKKEFTDKKILVGLLAIFLGSIGVHKFVLGFTQAGIIQIIATVCTFGFAGIIPFIEGIIYLTKSDDAFYQDYAINKKQWF